MSLKLITLNVEHGHHLSELFAFIQREQPDVLCVQEVFAQDVSLIEQKTGYIGYFSPTLNVLDNHGYSNDPRGIWGQMILVLPTLVGDSLRQMCKEYYYVGSKDNLPLFETPESLNHVLQVLTVEKAGRIFVIGNTHFTWSAEGQPTNLQRDHLRRLFAVLAKYPEIIICGDFNAPRGGEIYQSLAQRFCDCIPSEVTTTIDSKFHYSAKKLEYVVDYIFTTKNYVVESVNVECGVSDHCGVIGVVL